MNDIETSNQQIEITLFKHTSTFKLFYSFFLFRKLHQNYLHRNISFVLFRIFFPVTKEQTVGLNKPLVKLNGYIIILPFILIFLCTPILSYLRLISLK